MNKFSMTCAIGAVLCISSAAFAQDNPPSSNTGLQAGDNAQTTNQQAASGAMTHHKSMKKKKMSSSGMSNANGAPGAGGTATPGGPNAPVSASGSGG